MMLKEVRSRGGGAPTLTVSNNGKTFKATEKALRKLYNDPEARAHLETNQLDWRFNLQRAPWWGRFFKHTVGSVRQCLEKMLDNTRLSYDESLTALIEVEGMLNARRLTCDYDNRGGGALTSSHLTKNSRIVMTMPQR